MFCDFSSLLQFILVRWRKIANAPICLTKHKPWRRMGSGGITICILALVLDGGVVGRPRNRFPVVSLDFSVTHSFRSYHGPGVESAPCENEYQEYLLGVKVAGEWGWQPHHLDVPNVVEIWESKPPGTLWATPGLLRDSFSFTFFTNSWFVLSKHVLWF